MKGKRPDYTVSTVVQTDNGDRWRDIGVAFTSDTSGSITVLLDALPVSGKLILRTPQRPATSAPSS
ncbi:MAG: hypothetical protein HYR72_03680 [Deltaproteobacteria bacterium]|nr:hypothetical protein [Deltaproteobacteria bacterium]MBI3388711.1 hypothetical protein [Deltaproteobacteria bacterium]